MLLEATDQALSGTRWVGGAWGADGADLPPRVPSPSCDFRLIFFLSLGLGLLICGLGS